ncbi:MAG TPA: folate-binding protein YgfZ [Gammaproteobacteria bacterium]|nr:folate-binding protein YgfZ [Gammaproteobacteria bacterium]
MNPEWKAHLEQKGAVFDADTVRDFGDPQGETRATTGQVVLADLSHLGLIAAAGEDAMEFLQGQLSNDVRQVDTEHSQLAAYCSPKGRILADLRLFRREETYYLILPRAILEPTLKRLRMFVLRSRVTLNDASETLVGFGVAGPQADAALSSALGAVPGTVDEVSHGQGLSVIRLPGSSPRFHVFGSPEAAIALWERLGPQSRPVGAGAWGLLDILAGLPSIDPATVDTFVPQMVNLQAIGGVSFKKGCYPGQEVVARTHYLGKLKRRMYRAHVETDRAPQPGEEIYATDSPEQSAGRIVSAQRSPEGGYELLAVIQIASAEKNALHLGDAEGPGLVLRELPYALEA